MNKTCCLYLLFRNRIKSYLRLLYTCIEAFIALAVQVEIFGSETVLRLIN